MSDDKKHTLYCPFLLRTETRISYEKDDKGNDIAITKKSEYFRPCYRDRCNAWGSPGCWLVKNGGTRR